MVSMAKKEDPTWFPLSAHGAYSDVLGGVEYLTLSCSKSIGCMVWQFAINTQTARSRKVIVLSHWASIVLFVHRLFGIDTRRHASKCQRTRLIRSAKAHFSIARRFVRSRFHPFGTDRG